MKILLVIIAVMTLLVATSGVAVAEDVGPPGPAPNSGDGDPDGSGWDMSDWPNEGPGPAPNSGDGDPDGSGF